MVCKYCGKKIKENFCNLTCENEYKEYCKNVEKNTKLFLLGIFGPIIVYCLPIFIGHELFIWGIASVLFGIAIAKLPFATPETIDSIGVKKAVKIMKTIGIIFIIVGLILTIFSITYLF